jgi:hypothetical protein
VHRLWFNPDFLHRNRWWGIPDVPRNHDLPRTGRRSPARGEGGRRGTSESPLLSVHAESGPVVPRHAGPLRTIRSDTLRVRTSGRKRTRRDERDHFRLEITLSSRAQSDAHRTRQCCIKAVVAFSRELPSEFTLNTAGTASVMRFVSGGFRPAAPAPASIAVRVRPLREESDVRQRREEVTILALRGARSTPR